MSNPALSKQFQVDLLRWFGAHARKLPWRQTPSLYGTIVSEFMLQQTQVKTMLPFYARWLQQFPTLNSLASAPTEQVLKAWEGLGYYNRARNLHTLAQQLTQLKTIPTDEKAWLAFRGIGPYSAASITSIAFNTPAACVDGNVVRVYARLYGLTNPMTVANALKTVTPLAQTNLETTQAGNFNQALMELGATLCTKTNPNCDGCPVRAHCKSAGKPNLNQIPLLLKNKSLDNTIYRGLYSQNGLVALTQINSQTSSLNGYWELPTLNVPPSQSALFSFKRQIGRTRIQEHVYLLTQLPTGAILKDPTHTALSGPHRRTLIQLKSLGYWG